MTVEYNANMNFPSKFLHGNRLYEPSITNFFFCRFEWLDCKWEEDGDGSLNGKYVSYILSKNEKLFQ